MQRNARPIRTEGEHHDSIKFKIVGLLTTVALFALPVSEALANRYI